jgi:hypothetical protein
MKLFVSYSHKDGAKVAELASLLSPFHDLWIDKQSIAPGRDWKEEIEKGIKRCNVFVFVASKSSCLSEECQWEVTKAIQYRKPIIPLILETCELEPALAKLQWIFIQEDMDEGVRLLLNELQPAPPYQWVALSLIEFLIILCLLLN